MTYYLIRPRTLLNPNKIKTKQKKLVLETEKQHNRNIHFITSIRKLQLINLIIETKKDECSINIPYIIIWTAAKRLAVVNDIIYNTALTPSF